MHFEEVQKLFGDYVAEVAELIGGSASRVVAHERNTPWVEVDDQHARESLTLWAIFPGEYPWEAGLVVQFAPNGKVEDFEVELRQLFGDEREFYSRPRVFQRIEEAYGFLKRVLSNPTLRNGLLSAKPSEG